MPPFLPRKRFNSTPPDSPRSSIPPTKKQKVADTERRERSTLQANREFVLGSNDSESSLSEVESEDLEEFEDVEQPNATAGVKEEEENDDEDDIDWEDAVHENGHGPASAAQPTGDLQLKLSKDVDEAEAYGSLSAALQKKGPTKKERQARLQTHYLHVQYLMFHNATRNNWIGNQDVQQTLVKQLPPGIQKEIERWRVASGLVDVPAPEPKPAKKEKSKKRKSRSQKDDRNERDWGEPSQRLERGRPDMSHGDPLISLLKVLAAYWKKRFRITAPGLRKTGYRTRPQLAKHIASWRNDKHNPLKHGENIKGLDHFKELARKCEGSRDVGTQLFTALLRGIGIEARMVASLQPIGFGWTKGEQAAPTSAKKEPGAGFTDSDDEAELSKKGDSGSSKKSTSNNNRTPRGRGRAENPIDVDSADDSDSIMEIKDDESVVDVTPKSARAPMRRFDKDLPFPIYWTEAISPITHKPIPLSPFIGANAVATTEDLLAAFEPRGAKAEKAKQVIAYVIAFSPDGSAKDVTTRYLKRHMWPGKTKGVRLPLEKVAIYNKKGKIKRHEEFDWFKTVMSGYNRRDDKRTAVDDLEDSTDLVPQQPEKKKAEQVGDTLQSLKSSADFVLQRHLRREEALKPDAKSVRTFNPGKGAQEENVYLRADVVPCMSAESWHKHGRRPMLHQTPLKLVPIRAVTMTRKREVEEAERMTGEKPTQGLYSIDQTEYIIPPPIRDGLIPKNAYGNIDCFVPSMVPEGAIHIPLRGTVRICKKLEIDFAEAVTGFEFGNKMAVPVITGVVIAEENEHAVIDAWEEWNEQQRIKEEGKQQKAILALWRKMIMGLRINERVQGEYGDLVEPTPADSNHIDLTSEHGDAGVSFEDNGSVGGGGFLLSEEEDNHEDSELVVEHNDQDAVRRRGVAVSSYPTPMSASTKQPDERDDKATSDSSLLSELNSGSEAESEQEAPTKLLPTGRNAVRKGPPKRKSAAATRNAKVRRPTDSDDSDEEISDTPEIYTPKPTRTRASRQAQDQSPKSKSTGKRPSSNTTTPKRKGRGGKKGGQSIANGHDADDNEEDGEGIRSPYF